MGTHVHRGTHPNQFSRYEVAYDYMDFDAQLADISIIIIMSI